MIKIDRRGYKQHIRILCITSERLYIITKKDPYPKEAVMLKDILNISCTPYKDGFICLHTRETREDRVKLIILSKIYLTCFSSRVIGFLFLIIHVNFSLNFLWS